MAPFGNSRACGPMPVCSAASAITRGTFNARAMKPARRPSTASEFCATRPALIRWGNGVLNVAGVDYQSSAGDGRTCRDAEKLVVPGVANLLLSHNPDVFPVAVRKGYDAVLSGHTHGGQVTVEILESDAQHGAVRHALRRGPLPAGGKKLLCYGGHRHHRHAGADRRASRDYSGAPDESLRHPKNPVRYLIVSDLHSNWEALEAVLERRPRPV